MKDDRKTKRQLIQELGELRAALADGEERFRSLVELAPDTIAVHQDGKIVYVNAAGVRLMGAESAEQLVGTPALERVHPDDRAVVAERIGRMLRDGVAAEPIGERFVRLDGSVVEVEVRAAPITYGGRPAVQVVARDMTERRRVEEALRESEARYRKLVEPAPVGVYRTTVGGDIEYANPALIAMLGFESFDEFREAGVVVRYANPDDRKRLLESLERNGSVRNFELDALTKDGEIRRILLSATLEGDQISGMIIDVTERRRAEEALREREELYRTLFENAPIGIGLADAGGTLLEFNDAMLEAGGYSREDAHLVGNARQLYYDPKEREALLSELGERGLVRQREVRFKRKDGLPYDAAVSLARVGLRGKPAVLAIVEDVTERKRLHEELQRSAALYRALVEQMPAIIYRRTVDGSRLTYTSPQIEPLLGYAPEDWMADPQLMVKRLHPDDKERVLKSLAASSESGEPFIEEYRLFRRDGGVVWFSDQAVIVRHPAGTVEIQGVMLDITKRKEVEEERALLSAVVEQATYVAIITDLEGTILYVNRGFETITGYTREEAVGQNPRILKSGRHEQAFYEEMWDTIASGDVWAKQFVNRRKDGTLYHQESLIFPVYDAAGGIRNYACIGRDVTREMELEAQLSQAQKMEAVGRLAGGVAHDFNNTLTVILAETDMALAEVAAGSEAHDALSEIKKAAERSALLTGRLLAFSRKQLVKHTVFDLSELVRDMDTMIRRVIGEDIELVTRTGKVDPVRADRGQVEQVLLNLVVNARDAMPRGGKLVIQTGNATLDDEYAESHPGASAGEYVMLAVSDSGTGMTDEVKGKIFEPFFTTKERGTGTGLGLATCYGIVKQLGGYIGVYSEVGVGTTMKVYLPRAAGVPESPRGRAADHLPRGTETILLVEDEESVRLVAARVLRRQGYTVLEASSGEEAMTVLKEHPGEVELLLSDVVLPGAGGRAVAEMVKAVQPEIKVLFVSGYTDDVILRHRLRDQKVEFLSKPFTLESLTQKVREVLDAS